LAFTLTVLFLATGLVEFRLRFSLALLGNASLSELHRYAGDCQDRFFVRRSVTWYKSGLSNKALLVLEKLSVALDTDPGFLIVRESPKKRNK
jgi:hypothetical protein